MKLSSICQTATLLGLSMALGVAQVQAATFDQKDLDPSRVIAVAVPLSQGERYNLLILEQLSTKRLCWQDSTATPGAVDPLLLQFDFTDICGRSTDSNGYSIRLAGEDKGIDYRLSILKQGDRLKLVGLPNRPTSGPILEIAQTESTAPGFLRLTLNPEWRFAKRTYQGKALGHIYLARNTAQSPAGDSLTPYPLNLASRNPFSQNLSSTSGRVPSAPLFRGRPSTPRPLNQSSAYSRVGAITAPVQIQVPEPQGTSRSLSAATSPNDFSRNGVPTLSGSVLPVPSANIPMGKAGDEPDLITASTPRLDINAMTPSGSAQPGSFQVAMANYRFRVYVNPANTNQQRAVKALVPDSFRSSYQGRTMLQVGAFQERGKADEVLELLSRNGITGILSSEN